MEDAVTSNYTKIPNEVFDEWASKLPGNSFLVLCWIYRCTIGMQAEFRTITFDEFKDGLRMSNGDRFNNGLNLAKTTLLRALDDLEKKDLITIKANADDGARIKKRYKVNLDKIAPKRNLDTYRNETSEYRNETPLKEIETGIESSTLPYRNETNSYRNETPIRERQLKDNKKTKDATRTQTASVNGMPSYVFENHQNQIPSTNGNGKHSVTSPKATKPKPRTTEFDRRSAKSLKDILTSQGCVFDSSIKYKWPSQISKLRKEGAKDEDIKLILLCLRSHVHSDDKYLPVVANMCDFVDKYNKLLRFAKRWKTETDKNKKPERTIHDKHNGRRWVTSADLIRVMKFHPDNCKLINHDFFEHRGDPNLLFEFYLDAKPSDLDNACNHVAELINDGLEKGSSVLIDLLDSDYFKPVKGLMV